MNLTGYDANMNRKPNLGTVILVDDDKVDQMMFKRVLNRSGVANRILFFQHPDEALDFLKIPGCEDIYMLFLDICMPRLDGFEFLDRAMSEVGPDFATIDVIILSTSSCPGDKERAASFSNVRDYLVKPLTDVDLKRVTSHYREA